MTEQTASAALTRYPCARLPECAWLWANTALREELRASCLDPEALRTRAREMVTLHVLGRVPYRGGGSEFMMGLLNKGYSREGVAQALADAWLAGRDTFDLPRCSRWAWVHTLWGRLLLALLLTFVLLGMGMKTMARINPEVDVYLLAFPPLLAIVGFVVMLPVYQILKRVLDGLQRREPADRERASP
jgi:hypothetical protein